MRLFQPTREDSHDVPLYHYTDAAGFYGIISQRAIRLTHSAYLNDAQEVCRGQALYRECLSLQRKEYTDVTPILEPVLDFDTELRERYGGTYVASFSAIRDSLSQWRAYAQNGGGYCIGWKPEVLFEALESGKQPRPYLMKCVYDEDDFIALVSRSIRARLDGIRQKLQGGECPEPLTMHQSSNLVTDISLETVALGPERFRPGLRGLVPYLEAQFGATAVEVILGPTQTPDVSAQVAERFLRQHEFSATVEQSRTPYRV